MKTTPLHEVHKSLGAKFAEVHGWEIPAHYGDPVSEHLVVRKDAGIMDASHRGKVRISGRDRTAFLQKILSQDINRLTPGSGAYSTLLDVKGRMLAYMRIYCDEESLLMDTEPGLNEKIVQTLNHYLFREDVVIEDVTLKYGLVTIQGPRSRELLSRATGIGIADMAECTHFNPVINDIHFKVVRTTYTGEEGYDIYAPWDGLQTLWGWLLKEGENTLPFKGRDRVGMGFSGETHPHLNPLPEGEEIGTGVFTGEITLFGLDALETLRIEAGTPLYSVDMDEHTLPVEAGLDKAISYDKGCYIGQETISRIKFRGHVNRTFTGFVVNLPSMNNPPSPPLLKGGNNNDKGGLSIPVKGDRIYKMIHDTEHSIGVITSGCLSPTLNRPIALGYIRIGQSEPGEIVFIDRGGQRLTAIVTRLPFVKKPLTKG